LVAADEKVTDKEKNVGRISGRPRGRKCLNLDEQKDGSRGERKATKDGTERLKEDRYSRCC
jgi:hypothetical protein